MAIHENGEEINLYDRENYNIGTFDDEIRIDNNCKALLQQFHKHLLDEKKIAPLQAGMLASGADFYLRDFMIDQKRANIFSASADSVRRFAGNWYIITTLEPNMVELKGILNGISSFYSFCAEKKVIKPETAAAIAAACQQHEFYAERIESFHAISGDGFMDWNKMC